MTPAAPGPATTISPEQQQLLQSVKQWFRRREQVAHYTATLDDGLSAAEAWLLASLGSHQHVVDLDCGAGRVALALAQQYPTITATDISYELLLRGQQVAQARRLHIQFIQVEPLQLPFRTASISLALAFKVYCYIPSRSLRIQYLREIARVLQPGGVLAMTHYVTPAEWIAAAYDESYQRIARDYVTLEPGDTFAVLDEDDDSCYSYVHWFTEQELHEELEESGLEMIINASDKEHGGDGYVQLIALRKPVEQGS